MTNVLVVTLILIFSIVYGWLCLTTPISVLRLIAWWPKFVFTRLLPGVNTHPGLGKLISEIDNFSGAPSKELQAMLRNVKTTGLVAWGVALTYGCLLVLTLIQK